MIKKFLYVGGGIIALLVVIGIFAPEPEKNAVRNLEQSLNSEVSTTGELSPLDSSVQAQKTYDVVKVVDGDTLDVSIEGKVERLRLIGIDTPETVDPRKPVECFGIEASNKAKAVLAGKKVSLEGDNTQGERDKYDRLLRYVFLEDGTNFNLFMVKEGYAYEYTYSLPYKYHAEFKLAQKNAEINKKGLWASGVCEDDTKTIPATITPQPIKTSSQCNPNYSGCLKKNAGDYDCSSGSGDGPNYTGAVRVLGYDEYGLDRDGDGWGCE